MIGNDPAKWLPTFFPEAVNDRAEVSEEDIEEEDVTFEFEDMDYDVAEDLLAQVMAQEKQGTIDKISSGEWR